MNPPYSGSTSLEVIAGVLADGVTIVPFKAASDGTLATSSTAGAPAISATTSPSLDTSFGAKVTNNTKGTAAQLVSLRATNANAAVRYFQLFNATSATGTPIYSEPIPAGTTTQPSSLILDSVFFGQGGKNFSTALSWGISTTQTSYTAATAADHSVTVHYY